MILYRPVNQYELKKIQDNGWNEFPPRLPEQPIFYPVLSVEYAQKINEWNKVGYGEGYIIEFEINDNYISKFDVHNVGSKIDNEYWIPAEELENFNKHIIGNLKIWRNQSFSIRKS